MTAGGVTGPARFISAWTEQARTPPPTGFDRPLVSATVVDRSAEGAKYFGLGVIDRTDGDRLFAADFSRNRIDVFDKDYAALDLGPDAFHVADGSVDQAVYAPFNVQVIGGRAYVAEFDLDGRHIRTLEGGEKLNAPWGLALAPAGVGELSGALLIGNFGDGSIVGFDPTTGAQLDYLRPGSGDKLLVDGLSGRRGRWGVRPHRGRGARAGIGRAAAGRAGERGACAAEALTTGRCCPTSPRMLHLAKLAVGVRDIAHLRRVQAGRMSANPPLRHQTRSVPRRRDEIIAGGSIYWVVAGAMLVRQRVLDVVEDRWDDGTRCAGLVLDPELVQVLGRPTKAFQGWRYLLPEDAPADLVTGAPAADETEMPPALRQKLMALCLL